MRSFTSAVAAVLAGQAFGTVHHMFSGVFSGTDIYAIEFDDEANTLIVAANLTTVGSTSKWIAIDERKENIYVANLGQYDSYKITNSTGFEYTGTVTIEGNCANANYIIATTSSPYTVFGAPYSSGCPAQMMSVDSTGTLTTTITNVTYGSTAAVHGLALSSDNKFLYSADDPGNSIWVHSINITAGTATEIQHLAGPSTGADPRHLVVHPAGNYAYVVLEGSNEIGVYSRDTSSGMLTYTNTSYSLLPSGFTNTTSYWADEVNFSINSSGTPNYMYASTRSRTTTIPGYVSAFSINTTTGAIKEQLFLTETNGSGGAANSVTPAPWAEEYFAITDNGSNFVEVWMITANGSGSVIGKAIAHLDLAAGPSDVVFYD